MNCMSLFQIFLSLASLFQFLIFLSSISCSTLCLHLNLGLPFLLVPSCCLSDICFTTLVSGILFICPSHSNFLPFITSKMSVSPYKSYISLFSLVSYSSPTFFPLYILLRIFLSHISNFFSSFLFRTHASHPYNTVGLIIVLYTRSLILLDIFFAPIHLFSLPAHLFPFSNLHSMSLSSSHLFDSLLPK